MESMEQSPMAGKASVMGMRSGLGEWDPEDKGESARLRMTEMPVWETSLCSRGK